MHGAPRAGKFSFEGREWRAVSPEAIHLITAMLTHEHLKRPLAESLLKHKWFKIQEETSDVDSNPIGSMMMDRLRQFGGMQRMKRLALTCLVRTLNNRDVKHLLVRPLRYAGCSSSTREWLGLSNGVPPVPGWQHAVHGRLCRPSAFCRITATQPSQRMQEYFEAKDPEKTGFLDHDQFHLALEKVGASMPAAELESLIAMFPESDRHGRINYNDFVAAMLDTSCVAKQDSAVRRSFEVRPLPLSQQLKLWCSASWHLSCAVLEPLIAMFPESDRHGRTNYNDFVAAMLNASCVAKQDSAVRRSFEVRA